MRTQSIFLAILAAGCSPALQPATTETVGWGDGELAPDVHVADQYGEPLSLASLPGSLVLVHVTAIWAAVGSDIPNQTAALSEQYSPHGLVYVTVITENLLGEPAIASDQLAWADEFGVTSPVVGPSALWPDTVGAWLIGHDGRVLDEVKPYTSAGIEHAVVESL